MIENNWIELTKSELNLASEARQIGNEGRARVCARRAAGHVIGEFIHREGIAMYSESALDRLRFLESYPSAPKSAKVTATHFLVHMTPEHTLPIDADLIADVEFLARELLGEEIR